MQSICPAAPREPVQFLSLLHLGSSPSLLPSSSSSLLSCKHFVWSGQHWATPLPSIYLMQFAPFRTSRKPLTIIHNLSLQKNLEEDIIIIMVYIPLLYTIIIDHLFCRKTYIPSLYTIIILENQASKTSKTLPIPELPTKPGARGWPRLVLPI